MQNIYQASLRRTLVLPVKYSAMKNPLKNLFGKKSPIDTTLENIIEEPLKEEAIDVVVEEVIQIEETDERIAGKEYPDEQVEYVCPKRDNRRNKKRIQ